MEKKITNIKERVLIFCKYKKLSIEPFLESIGMTYGSFKGKAKNGSLNSDAIANIYTKFEELNLEWLLTGKGEMIKDSGQIDLNLNKSTFKSDLKLSNDLLIESMKETIESQKTTINILEMVISKFQNNYSMNPPLVDFNFKKNILEQIAEDQIKATDKILKK